MKNRIIIMAAAIAALAVSCQKEEIPTPVVKTEPMVIATGVDTKTILDNQKDILWTPGDKIMVLDNKGNKSEFKDENLTKNSASANFAGSVTDGTTKFLAIYPSSCVTSISTFTDAVVTIPDVQIPKVGSFETEHNISAACGNKTPGTPNVGNVVFENIGGLLKFSLPTDLTNIASVSISSTSDIAGSVKVSSSDDGICTTFTGGAKTITMNPGSGKTFTFEDGEVNTFWFALAPVSLNDITISVSTDKGYTYSMKKEWDNPLVIEAGKFRNLGTLVMKQATVVAEHTTNSMGQLNGTKLDITLPDDAKDIVLNLKNSQGLVWKNINSLNVKGAETYTSYPYLPKGTYQLSGTYTIKSNGTKVTLGTTIVTVPAPTFSVTPAKAHTSYNLYFDDEDIDGANDCDGRTIYNLHNGVTPSISSDLLSTYGYKITTQTPDGEIETLSYKFGATSLGSKDITTNFTFDGVKVSSSPVTYHITGLPYTQLTEDGWQSNVYKESIYLMYGVVVWGTSGVLLGNNKSADAVWEAIKNKISSWGWTLEDLRWPKASTTASIQKTFYIPSAIDVITTVSGAVVAEVDSYQKQTGTQWGFIPTYTTYYKHDVNSCIVTVGDSNVSVDAKSDYNSSTKPNELTVPLNKDNCSFESTFTSRAPTVIIKNENSDNDNRTSITALQILYR